MEDDEREETAEAENDFSGAPYQQTINRSFTLAGSGLHSAEEVCVRVRPAFAGDGKYFVRVPEGTNRHLVGDGIPVREPIKGRSDLEEAELQTMAFMQYTLAQENGYEGTFKEYIFAVGLDDEFAGLQPLELDNSKEECVEKGREGEVVLEAHIGNVGASPPHCSIVGTPGGALVVASVELLLGTLEGMHVDNARIEIEGGNELPILDGSAQVWVDNIAAVGICPAYSASGALERKLSFRAGEPITAYGVDAFITLYPSGLAHKLSVGVGSDVPAVGDQWVSFEMMWRGEPKPSFVMDIAPARTWLSSSEQAYRLRDQGYLKNGTIGCVMVAEGEQWLASGDLRFVEGEACRHSAIDLLGDLALLGEGGNTGVPCGHVVAYNADHALRQTFARNVRAYMDQERGDMVPFMLTEDEVQEFQEQQEQAMQENMAILAEQQDSESDSDGDEEGGPGMTGEIIPPVGERSDDSDSEFWNGEDDAGKQKA